MLVELDVKHAPGGAGLPAAHQTEQKTPTVLNVTVNVGLREDKDFFAHKELLTSQTFYTEDSRVCPQYNFHKKQIKQNEFFIVCMPSKAQIYICHVSFYNFM